MQEYNLIECGSHELFVDTIDAALRDGWTLYGQPIIFPTTDDSDRIKPAYYIQSMVRDIKESQNALTGSSILNEI